VAKKEAKDKEKGKYHTHWLQSKNGGQTDRWQVGGDNIHAGAQPSPYTKIIAD
jgi:hypothetical protein